MQFLEVAIEKRFGLVHFHFDRIGYSIEDANHSTQRQPDLLSRGFFFETEVYSELQWY